MQSRQHFFDALFLFPLPPWALFIILPPPHTGQVFLFIPTWQGGRNRGWGGWCPGSTATLPMPGQEDWVSLWRLQIVGIDLRNSEFSASLAEAEGRICWAAPCVHWQDSPVQVNCPCRWRTSSSTTCLCSILGQRWMPLGQRLLCF